MKAATYHLQALDPLWFRGLGPGGNTWDPTILHATAMNFALIKAIGFGSPHRRFTALWTPHSLPYRKLGVWVSPAELVPGTAQQVQVFRGGREGGRMQIINPTENKQNGVAPTHLTVQPDGRPARAPGRPTAIGKPFRTVGYFGEWTGIILVEDAEAAAIIPDEPFVIRLGPNMVPLAMTLSSFEDVKESTGGGLAMHLSDPFLVGDDARGPVTFARPFPLVRAVANGVTSFGPVRTFSIRSR